MTVFRGVIAVCAALALAGPAAASNGISFTASGARLTIRAPGYSLALARKDGRIVALDAGGAALTAPPTRCLWGALRGSDSSYVGGCSYRPAFRWSPASSTLTLTYRAHFGRAIVRVRAGATFFDLRLTLANHGLPLQRVRFPDGLEGDTRTVTAGYAPNALPGVRLDAPYFSRVVADVQSYPSRWAFADYLAYDTGRGHLALYTVAPTGPLHPTLVGFAHLPAPRECSGTAFCLIHEFQTWIKPGVTWTSPVVRVRLGQTAQQSILAYRHDNGIDAYPSLAAKLGARLATYARAPLIKANVPLLWPFARWRSHLDELPSPVILHPAGFQRGGFDHGDPDFLPPDPVAAGSTADFASMIADAHAHGDLVMPYGNLGWWDPGSPSSAATQVKAVAALDAHGRVQTVDYGPSTGVIVSPYAPAVKQRIASYMREWRTDVPSDCLFLDQVGARPWLFDFNPASPTPLAYDDGWLDVLRQYRNQCLMVEDGWDRLGRDAVGFHGSLLMMARELDLPNQIYGAGNWEPYPLATWLLHDKVLMYQHDLYDGVMATDDEVLTWNMLFGLVSSYSWDALAPGPNPRLDLVGLLQRDLGPHYAGVALSQYRDLAPGVAEATYGDLVVTGNLATADYQGIAPDGFLARTPDVVAGIVEGSYDGTALSAGRHALVIERTAGAVTVRQPLGADTDVGIVPPTGPSPRVTALAADGSVVGPVAGALRDGRVVFRYAGSLGGRPVAAYRVTGS